MRLSHTSRRPATVTVIVIAFLALLAVVALTFALYGMREADESKVFRDSHNGGQTGMRFNTRGSSTSDQPPEPEVIINDALGKAIYGSPDDLRGYFNMLRHQEIARTMYGFNPVDPTGATQAYNGVGALPGDVVHSTVPPALVGSTNRVNWSWPGAGAPLLDSDNNYWRDPIGNTQPPYNAATYKYFARSANYTYPDRNNMFLGAVDPKSGRVLIPSYHRPWLLGGAPTPQNNESGPQQYITPDPNNPWLNPEGRYLMLRPRPIDHVYNGTSEWRYPEPDGQGGHADVENLPGKSIGRQPDSMWMDLDLPVGRWMGKSYKPMVAFLIVDTDGRINLNTAGNYVQQIAGGPPFKLPGSNQGIGPWEVNPTHVLRDSTNSPDYYGGYQIVSGPIAPPRAAHNRLGYTNPAGPIPLKRVSSYYGDSLFPNMPAPGSGAHTYSSIDFDGGGQQAQPYSMSIGHETGIVWAPPYDGMPGNAGNPPRPSGAGRYGNGIYIPGAYDERSHHPSMFNPYLLRARGAINPNGSVDLPNRVFGVEELRHLNSEYNYGNYQPSEVARLAQNSLGQSIFQSGRLNPRWATTVMSHDMHLPGASPWLNAPSNQYTLFPPGQGQPPSQPQGPPPSALDFTSPTANLLSADFDSSYRAKLASIVSAIDVTRKLTDYRNNASQPYGPMNMGNLNRAMQDRYNLCKDIFDRLRYATCGQSPGYTPAAATPEFHAHRFLAQLAVNIVDYIDNDDVMTVFPWNPSAAGNPFGTQADFTPPNNKQRVVFGFERPRLVMNETYIRYENDISDPKTQDPMDMNKPKARLPYQMKIWMELHNPLTPANPAEQFTNPQLDDGNNGGYRAKLVDTLPGGETSIYRILISKVNRNPAPMDPTDPMLMRTQDNVDGTPDNMAAQIIRTVDFRSGNVTHPPVGQPKVVQPNIGGNYGPNSSFYILGPEQDGPPMMANQPAQFPGNENPPIQANLTTRDLQYPMDSPGRINAMGGEPNDIDINTNRPNWVPGFTLQRLANPYADGPMTNPLNPYVTTDYLNPDLNAGSIYDRVEASFSGNPNNMGIVPDLLTTFSWGRRQPYDAFINYGQQNRYRQQTNGAAAGQVGGQTFGRHNGSQLAAYPGPGGNDTLEQPFRPLVHLDRVLLSQAELMHVVAVKPHELTQTYQAPPNGQRWQFTANWLDQGVVAPNRGTYLWRALEFLKVPTRHAGLGMGGRVAGKVNINTTYAQEIFDAVCDAQSGTNRFSQAQVNQAWQVLRGQRTPNWTTEPPSPNPFSAQDRPFYGMAAAVSPQTPPNSSVMDQHRTIVHAPQAPGQRGLWDGSIISGEDYFPSPSANAGAVQKFELLSKVFNQFTTRSNCFTVYATIGYFEVRNPGPYNETNRPILGKELGLDEGQVTRHKFFSVIDRTNLSIETPAAPNQPIRQGAPPVYFSYQPNVPLPTAANGYTVVPDPLPTGLPTDIRIPITGRDANGRLMGHYDGTSWTIQNGVSRLEIGIGQNVESNLPITVLPPDPMDPATSTTTAVSRVTLTRAHDRGAQMRLMNPDPNQMPSVPGNPGPQPGFNYKSQRYAPVVKYVEQLR